MKRTIDNYVGTGNQECATLEENRSFGKRCLDAYFEPKSFERWQDGRIYEWLGVKYVQKAIMGTVGKLFRRMGADENAGGYFIGKRPDSESLKTFENLTRFFELFHAPQILWNIDSLSRAVSEECYGSAVVYGVCLLVNAGCSMLQRYNRARVQNVIDKRYGGRK